MENVENKNCSQDLKSQNILLTNMICIKNSLHRGQRNLKPINENKTFKTEI